MSLLLLLRPRATPAPVRKVVYGGRIIHARRLEEEDAAELDEIAALLMPLLSIIGGPPWRA